MLAMTRVAVMAASGRIADVLAHSLSQSPVVEACYPVPDFTCNATSLLTAQAINTVVYVPQCHSQPSMIPDLAETAAVYAACAGAEMTRVVVVSSAAIYGATPHNPGLMRELRPPARHQANPIGNIWAQMEAMATTSLAPPTALTILRPATLLIPGEPTYFSRLFSRRLAITLPWHDPSVQLLSLEDLANAVCAAVEGSVHGVFNVAPAGVIPLRTALRLAGVRRVPIGRPWQRLPRAILAALGLAAPIEQLEYMRYSWTVSPQKLQQTLGVTPAQSSAAVLRDFLRQRLQAPQHGPEPSAAFDDFGMDSTYIQAWQRRLFRFLHHYYWRIEIKGLEHVPQQGRAILAGTHRGFMPFDAMMILHLVAQHVGRYVRFLIHPGLTKTPFPFNWWKLGGVNACQDNADYMLQHDALLGYFPEGIQGAFRYYREAYRLGKFGREEYVKAALRNRAPIVPFVTVGSAEIFPIIAKIHWRWWQRTTMWPCIPIAPPFPLLPLPWPSKWHTQFLEPLHVERQYPPEAARDAATVRAISQEVRTRMQDALDDMCKRRKSIFFGSIFESEAQEWVSGRTSGA